jgi:hypothetical protein
LREALLILFRKDKAWAHGMLARERTASQDADAAGLLDAEQDAASFPFTTRHIAGCLHFLADPVEHRGGTLDQERTLRDTPSFEAGDRVGWLFSANFRHF